MHLYQRQVNRFSKNILKERQELNTCKTLQQKNFSLAVKTMFYFKCTSLIILDLMIITCKKIKSQPIRNLNLASFFSKFYSLFLTITMNNIKTTQLLCKYLSNIHQN